MSSFLLPSFTFLPPPSFPASPILPSHVKVCSFFSLRPPYFLRSLAPRVFQTILVTGAGGFVGQRLLSSLLSLYPSITIVATDMRPPPIPSGLSASAKAEERIVSLAADLGDPVSIATLFEGRKVDVVFALHGIMSGGSEADFELGYRGEFSCESWRARDRCHEPGKRLGGRVETRTLRTS